MKKKWLITFVCILVCVMSMAIPAFAMEARASQQIKTYDIDVSAQSNSIDAYFLVNGTGPMNKLGCERIDIYTKSGSSWIWSTGKSENDTGMSKTGGQLYANTISFSKSAGTRYRVAVTIFAEDNNGRDTRTEIFYF